jgi:hypothetical protein
MFRRPSSAQLLRERPLYRPRNARTISELFEGYLARFGALLRMDGAFYQDTRLPFSTADQSAVTLAATMKALYPAAAFPSLGVRYFDMIGKKVRIRAFGKITTAATPGNGQFGVFWGSGADNTGTSLGTSVATALTLNQTNLSWMAELYVHARALGASGSLFLSGWAAFAEGVQAPHLLIPNSAAAAVTVDLTANNVISLQFLRSGSTAETMTTQDLEVTALN